MRPRVYLETTVVSYLAARPSRDLVAAARQELTLEWWTAHRPRFDPYVSDIVIHEARQGDAEAARRRGEYLAGLPVLALDDVARQLARLFVDHRLIPAKALEDALHVAVATAQGMDFLLTWNCRHIANAEIIRRLEEATARKGFRLPTLCTPDQLMGD